MKNIDKKILNIVESIERWVIILLLFSLLIVVIYTGVVFLGLLFGGILADMQNSFAVDDNILNHLHDVFGGFLSVLIGIELLHTIKMYLKEDVVHVEIVLLVALIATSRHVIDLDIAHLEPLRLIGISMLILTLAGGYYLIKKIMRKKSK